MYLKDYELNTKGVNVGLSCVCVVLVVSEKTGSFLLRVLSQK